MHDRGCVWKDDDAGIRVYDGGRLGQGVEASVLSELRQGRRNVIAGRYTSLWRRGKGEIGGCSRFFFVIDVVHRGRCLLGEATPVSTVVVSRLRWRRMVMRVG